MRYTPEDFVSFCRKHGKSEEYIINVLCRKIISECSHHATTKAALVQAKRDLCIARLKE